MSWDALTLTGLLVSIIMISWMFFILWRDSAG